MKIDQTGRIFADPVGEVSGVYTGLFQFWALVDKDDQLVIIRVLCGKDIGVAYNLLEHIPGHEAAWARCKTGKLVRQATKEEHEAWIAFYPERWPQGPPSEMPKRVPQPWYKPFGDHPTIVRLGRTSYTRQYHNKPCENCDGGSPWYEKYKTCPTHSALPCDCKPLEGDHAFSQYCPRHGLRTYDVYEEMYNCEKCGDTLHRVERKMFIGSDGGVTSHACFNCGFTQTFI